MLIWDRSAKNYAAAVCRYLHGKVATTPVKTGRSGLTHATVHFGLEEGDKTAVESQNLERAA